MLKMLVRRRSEGRSEMLGVTVNNYTVTLCRALFIRADKARSFYPVDVFIVSGDSCKNLGYMPITRIFSFFSYAVSCRSTPILYQTLRSVESKSGVCLY